MRMNQKAVGATLTMVAAIALGMGAYARYRPADMNERHMGGNTAMDDPEYLRNDSSTVGNSTSRPSDTPSPTYRSTYDPTRKAIAESAATSTNTNTNRSSADQVDDDL